MKAFIRTLNIEERKDYIYVIFYTIFQSLSALLIKIMNQKLHFNNLTIITERGSLMALICLGRIIINFRNNKEKRHEVSELSNYRGTLSRGLINSLIYICLVFSISYIPMSSFFMISRLSFFGTIFIAKQRSRESIDFSLILNSIVNVFGTIVIMIAETETFTHNEDNYIGLIFAILSLILNTYADLNYKFIQNTNTDLSILFNGIFTVIFGCFLSINYKKSMEKLDFSDWIFVLLLSVFSYYSSFFHIKAVKRTENFIRLVPFSFLSIIFTYMLGLIFFNQGLRFCDILGVLIILLNTYYHTKNIIKMQKKPSSLSSDFY